MAYFAGVAYRTQIRRQVRSVPGSC